MEKLPGRPVGDMWFDLSEDQRLKITSEVVRAEAKLSKIDLPAYGSVYHEHDLPTDTTRTVISPTSSIKGLCIGPHTSLRWWYKERGPMEFNRGPRRYCLPGRNFPSPAPFHSPSPWSQPTPQRDLQLRGVFSSSLFLCVFALTMLSLVASTT